MATLTATSWTVAMANGTRYQSTQMLARKRHVQVKLTLTTGESPAAGVPWPTPGSMGLVRYVENIIMHNDVAVTTFTTARGRAHHWTINTSAKTFVPLQITLSTGTTGVSGGRVIRATATNLSITGSKVFYCTAIGW